MVSFSALILSGMLATMVFIVAFLAIAEILTGNLKETAKHIIALLYVILFLEVSFAAFFGVIAFMYPLVTSAFAFKI